MDLELFAPPPTEASLRVSPDPTKDYIVREDLFWLAVTHSAIEDILETPLIVAQISQSDWKRQQPA
jgi:hypothetical protein